MNTKQILTSLLLIALAAVTLPLTASAQQRVIRRVQTHRVHRVYRTPGRTVTTSEYHVPIRRYNVAPTRVYRRSYRVGYRPNVVIPNFGFYATYPQVYRYVRRPRYVWLPAQEEVQEGNTVYIYQNQPYEVQEREDSLPELDCPRNTSMRQSSYESWCATSRGSKHGPYVAYYKNGQVRTEGTYEYGTKNGVWIEYYQEGGIRSEGSFKDGKKVGTWVNYDSKGNETTTIFYEEN